MRYPFCHISKIYAGRIDYAIQEKVILQTRRSKTRDYSLFVIACEGTKTEPSYFAPFDEIDRIKVRLLEHSATESAPSHILERAKLYIAEEGLDAKYGDSLWCVTDVDKWPIDMINELASFCMNTPNCHIAVSNPCFEIWLLYHKLSDLSPIDCGKSHDVKVELSRLSPGGFFSLDYIKLMETAIINAKAKDSNPGEQHFLPEIRETKVYALAEALMDRIGKRRWTEFIDTILEEYKKKMYLHLK